LLAHAEDRDDVGVMQPGRGAGFPLEPAHLGRVRQGVGGQDLQRDAAAEALLLRLVDDAHAAAAHLAEDAEVAQPLQPDPADDHRWAIERAGGVTGGGLEVLHQEQRGEQPADLLGQLGVSRGVALD
jgi:hypothetical protein